MLWSSDPHSIHTPWISLLLDDWKAETCQLKDTRSTQLKQAVEPLPSSALYIFSVLVHMPCLLPPQYLLCFTKFYFYHKLAFNKKYRLHAMHFHKHEKVLTSSFLKCNILNMLWLLIFFRRIAHMIHGYFCIQQIFRPFWYRQHCIFKWDILNRKNAFLWIYDRMEERIKAPCQIKTEQWTVLILLTIITRITHIA